MVVKERLLPKKHPLLQQHSQLTQLLFDILNNVIYLSYSMRKEITRISHVGTWKHLESLVRLTPSMKLLVKDPFSNMGHMITPTRRMDLPQGPKDCIYTVNLLSLDRKHHEENDNDSVMLTDWPEQMGKLHP